MTEPEVTDREEESSESVKQLVALWNRLGRLGDELEEADIEYDELALDLELDDLTDEFQTALNAIARIEKALFKKIPAGTEL
jgi:hypothetical protein